MQNLQRYHLIKSSRGTMHNLSKIYESPEFKAFSTTKHTGEKTASKSNVYPLVKVDKNTHLLPEIWKKVFNLLQLKELYRMGLVCKNWRIISSDDALLMKFDLQELFPSLKIIDGNVWEKHWDLKALGLDISNAPVLDQREAYFRLKKLYTPGLIENNAGVTILTLPKGLSRANLPKVFRDIAFNHLMRLPGKDQVIEKTRTVMITNNIIKGSRVKSPKSQQTLLEGIGCNLPDVLTVMTLLGAINKISGKTICGFQDRIDLLATKSYTSDQLNGVHAAVGLLWGAMFKVAGSEKLISNREDFKRDCKSVINRSHDIGAVAMWEPVNKKKEQQTGIESRFGHALP